MMDYFYSTQVNQFDFYKDSKRVGNGRDVFFSLEPFKAFIWDDAGSDELVGKKSLVR